WLLRERVDPRDIVQAAVNPAELAGVGEALKSFVDGVSIAEVKEVDRRPNLAGPSLAETVQDELLEVDHVRYLYTSFGHAASATLSELCIQISDNRFCPILGGPVLSRAVSGSRQCAGLHAAVRSQLRIPS